MKDFLSRNLAFLENRASRKTIQNIGDGSTESTYLSVRPDKSGNLIFSANKSCGNSRYLHSRRFPEAEAERQVSDWVKSGKIDLSGFIVIIGLGGAFHVEALLSMMRSGGFLLIIDTDCQAVKTSLQHRNLSGLQMKQIDLYFCVSPVVDDIAMEYRYILSHRPNYEFFFYTHPGITDAIGEKYSALKKRLIIESKLDGMDRGTLAAFSDEWQQNAIINLPLLVQNPGIESLVNKFPDVPSVIVAAGPSLNQSLSELKKIQNKAVIICVGTALRSLMNAGIKPHFVVAVDSDPVTWNQYSFGIPQKTFLVAGINIYPPILKLFKKQLFNFTSSILTEFNQWLESFHFSPGELATGGTVAVSAIDLAHRMSCSPIILLGLDLAYLNDGTTHAKNSMYDGCRYPQTETVKVRGNCAKHVNTSRQFSLYIEILSKYLADIKRSRQVDIYNANTMGAFISGAELIHPSNIYRYMPSSSRYFHSTIKRIHKNGNHPHIESVGKAAENVRKELRLIEKLTNEAVTITEKLLGGTIKVNNKPSYMNRLNELDTLVKQQGSAMLLLSGAIKAVCMHVQSQKLETNTKQSGDDTYTVIQNSKTLYEQMKGGASWLRGLLKTSINPNSSVLT